MTEITPDTPEAVLAYLKLSLISLMPGRENIRQTAAETDITLPMLYDLHNLGETPYLDLGILISNSIVKHNYLDSAKRVHFCLNQLAMVASVNYCVLQSPGWRGKKLAGLELFGDVRSTAEKALETYGPREPVLGGVKNLYRLLRVLSSTPERKPWWDLDYMPPTRADIDTYVMHLRHMIGLQPNN